MQREQDDYVLRLIEESGVALRKLLQRFSLEPSSTEEIVQEAQVAQATLLGPHANIIPRVDADTAILLINNHHKVDLLIGFLRLEANASMNIGQEDRARELESRVEALEQAAKRPRQRAQSD